MYFYFLKLLHQNNLKILKTYYFKVKKKNLNFLKHFFNVLQTVRHKT